MALRRARGARRYSSPERPRIVLLDLAAWDSFASFAAAARVHGLQVVRVSPGHHDAAGPLRRFLDALVFGRAGQHRKLAPDEISDLDLGALLSPPTVDLQGAEDVVAVLRTRHDMNTTAALSRVSAVDLVPLLYDKLAMTRFAESLDIPVPQSRTELGVPSFPLVVKRAIGSGGQAVRLARSNQQLAEVLTELSSEPGNTVFFQDFEAGEIINFGGVAREGRLLAGCLYRAARASHDLLGPAVGLEVIQDQQLEQDIVRLLAALSYTGFFCIDYIQPAEGPALLIDFNPRVFGSWLALEIAGAHLLEAYLSLFGLCPEPSRHQVAPGSQQRVSLRASTVGSRAAAVMETWHTLRAIWQATSTSGFRFVLALTLRALLLLARRVLRGGAAP